MAGKLAGSSQSSRLCYDTASWRSETDISKVKDNPTNFRRHVAFPSRRFLQVPDSLVVCPYRNVLERVVVNPFGLTMYLLPHCVSHASPWAQQAFTCCADPDDESALFFGWSEHYFRHTAIYAFLGKFLNKSTHISRPSV